MAYTHTTLSQLRSALLDRLGDTSGIYWLSAECDLYITEALQTWGLLTGYWRDSGLLTTTSGTGFYNISAIQNSLAEDLLSYTVTDTTVATLIQYHLLEPPTGTSWSGSEQFTYNSLLGALQRRRDAFLVNTESVLGSFTQTLPAGSQSVDLPQTTLRVKNFRWSGAVTGVDWPLFQDDISGQRNYSNTYLLTQGVPQTYSSSSAQSLRYVIAPPSDEPGTIRVLAVQSGQTLTGVGTSLGIPDDMSWVVKWGTLADMLGREGPGQDLERSYFAERRWQLGIALSQINPTVINAELNGIALSTDSLNQLDSYNMNWLTSTGTPSFIASLRNYIALAPAPNGIYSVKLDVVCKAIIPTTGSDFIQIGQDYLNVILDYAEHLAAFKCGGYEFRHTFRAAENFFNAALAYNQRLAAQHPAIVELIRQSTQDDQYHPQKKATDNDILLSVSKQADAVQAG